MPADDRRRVAGRKDDTEGAARRGAGARRPRSRRSRPSIRDASTSAWRTSSASSTSGGGDFATGERLPPERYLARRLGVSLLVVREAMVALEIAGLVEVRTGSGTYVRGASTGNAQPLVLPDVMLSPFELVAARKLLEPEIARTAMCHVSCIRYEYVLLGTACGTTRATRCTGRPAAPSRGHARQAPLPHVPRDVTGVKSACTRRQERPADRRDDPRRRGRSVLPGGPRATRACDFWQATLPNATPDNIWYRFIVTDGTDTDYYADDTAALDGGLGAPTDDAVDQSWALTVDEPGFTAPPGRRSAVIYQIFPDRFRNGRADNDPKTGDVRYDDPVAASCRGAPCPRATAATTPTRRPTARGASNDTARRQPDEEQPRGRDYFGGDLKGVDQQLDYLQALGRQHDLLQPDLRLRLEPRLRHAGLPKIDPVLRHAEGLGRTWSSTPTQRGHADHPRRRVQPHVVGQPVLRPLPPLSRR